MLDIDATRWNAHKRYRRALIDGRFLNMSGLYRARYPGDPATYNTAYLNDMAKARACLGSHTLIACRSHNMARVRAAGENHG